MRRVLLVVSVLALAAGCSGKPADCEALAAEQPDCMNDDAIGDCEDTNSECAEVGGEVLTLESCPLQFACSAPLSE